jgi:transglutaminase-like putative cysteine protease
VLLLTVLAHQRERSTPLAFFLIAILLLVALVNYHSAEQGWRKSGLSFSRELRTDMGLVVVPLTLGLVGLATLSAWGLFGPLHTALYRLLWEQDQVEQNVVANSLGLESASSETTVLARARRGGLPQSHLIGSGPELSQQVVLLIQTDDPPPAPDSSRPLYYWRSLTYDRYTGRGWETSRTQPAAYEAGERIEAENQPGRILSQTVRTSDRFNGLVYVAGELITAAPAFSVEWRGPQDIFGASIAGSGGYQAQSRWPVFSEAQLRAAGDDYPPFIQNRYLHLPDTTPNRVFSLARDLTATAATPYDQAQALEDYLRTFPYTLDVPIPPAERDIADYFLFDLRQGYCDYYATAMVVLARAVGLPARLAVGYIQGQYEAEQQRYIVTEAEAHSWVEIYFPGSGWVTFEPTGGRPALERGSETASLAPPLYASTPTSPFPGTTLPSGLREKGLKSPLFWRLCFFLLSNTCTWCFFVCLVPFYPEIQ